MGERETRRPATSVSQKQKSTCAQMPDNVKQEKREIRSSSETWRNVESLLSRFHQGAAFLGMLEGVRIRVGRKNSY